MTFAKRHRVLFTGLISADKNIAIDGGGVSAGQNPPQEWEREHPRPYSAVAVNGRILEGRNMSSSVGIHPFLLSLLVHMSTSDDRDPSFLITTWYYCRPKRRPAHDVRPNGTLVILSPPRICR